MKNRSVLLCALLLASVSVVSAAPLVVISIDGLQPSYVTQADKYGLKVPVLRSFMRDGTYASGVNGVLPTVTYPSHTTLLTGVTPAEHGISTNLAFDPLNTNQEGWNWYATDIKVPTLWSATADAKLTSASISWPVTIGETHVTWLLPEYWRASNADDLKAMRPLARPLGLQESLERELGPYIDGNTDTIPGDEIRTRFTVQLLKEKHPDFLAVHLIALDETEHEDGPFQTTAFATLESLDAMIGKIRESALAVNPKTIVAVVSDHGFAATHSIVNLRVPLVAAGLIRLKPAITDRPARVESWDAQVWPSGGVAAIVLRDRKDAKVRQQVDALLSKLQSDPHNGIARVLSGDEAHKLGGFPEADWVVDCAPGFYAGITYRGEVVAPAPSKGMHGYVPGKDEMHASFFMQGAGVGKHALGVIDMRQIAPTFARILGVKLPAATQPVIAFQ
jgi:predicted AlkP superfamily pyrophosphatase or phosphodiesterase